MEFKLYLTSYDKTYLGQALFGYGEVATSNKVECADSEYPLDAHKLLVDEKVLWAGYHYQTENDKITKQRVLRIFNEQLEEYYNKKVSATIKEMDKMSTLGNDGKESDSSQGQNVQESQTDCPSQVDKTTISDGQNDPLVYKENIKEYNYKKDDELNSSFMDSHNAHPEPDMKDIFGGVYRTISKNKRRSLEEIENSLYDIEDDEI